MSQFVGWLVGWLVSLSVGWLFVNRYYFGYSLVGLTECWLVVGQCDLRKLNTEYIN